MKFISCTFNGNDISIIVKNIQAVVKASGDRDGKANIVMIRSCEETDDHFQVDQTYREVLMMISNLDL